MFNHTRLWAAATIIGAIIIGGFVLSVPRGREVPEGSAQATAGVPKIVVRNAFKKGVHTLSGSVLAPDACTSVSAEASLVGDEILLALSMSEDVDICLEVSTPVTFSTSLEAPVGASVRTTLNDAPVTPSES